MKKAVAVALGLMAYAFFCIYVINGRWPVSNTDAQAFLLVVAVVSPFIAYGLALYFLGTRKRINTDERRARFLLSVDRWIRGILIFGLAVFVVCEMLWLTGKSDNPYIAAYQKGLAAGLVLVGLMSVAHGLLGAYLEPIFKHLNESGDQSEPVTGELD